MASASPTASGFRLIFRNPAIPLAEIAWRWSFAAATWFLGLMFLVLYADSLKVNALDRLLLGTQQPVLVLKAIHRIFEGSGYRFTIAGTTVAFSSVIAWIFVASLGRSVTLRAVVAELAGSDSSRSAHKFRSLLGLNFVRAAAGLAMLVGCGGSLLFASSFWASTHMSAAGAFRLWFALFMLTGLAWSVLNWFLSTASVFVIVKGDCALDAVAATVRFVAEQRATMFVPGIWFGLVHLGFVIFACGAGFTVMGMAALIGPAPTFLLEFLITFSYCAAADWLYVGRLAAYVQILCEPEVQTPATEKLPSAPQDQRTAVDAGELILSDVPLPAS